MEQDGSSNRGETEHQLKKYREVEFFGLLPPKPIYMGRRRSWRVAADCKSVPLQVSGFESHPPHHGQFGSFCLKINNKITCLRLEKDIFGSHIQKGNNVCRVG